MVREEYWVWSWPKGVGNAVYWVWDLSCRCNLFNFLLSAKLLNHPACHSLPSPPRPGRSFLRLLILHGAAVELEVPAPRRGHMLLRDANHLRLFSFNSHVISGDSNDHTTDVLFQLTHIHRSARTKRGAGLVSPSHAINQVSSLAYSAWLAVIRRSL